MIPLQPPLRLTILSSQDSKSLARARELEKTLNGTAAGIGWELGELESPEPGEEMLGERLEMRVFQAPPPQPAPEWLDATLHSVVLVLVDDHVLGNAGLMRWLDSCAAHLKKEPRRHALVAVPFSDEIEERWLAGAPQSAPLQTLRWTALDPEKAGRADQLALRVLHRLIHTVAHPLFHRCRWKVRLFLSHAKLDGFHLAQSLRHFLDRQGWLESFYDARDIEPGVSWEDELRDGVAHSALLILRSDAYDRRLWCRQEVRWSETFAVPRVVVDARSGLTHPASDLALECAPTVRVPDGNLSRVLFAALQTVLRSLLFQRRVLELRQSGALPEDDRNVRVLPVTPGIDALAYACRDLGPPGSGPRWLIHPDPPLRPGLREAGEALAQGVGAKLVTPTQVAAETNP